jgi:hypothetical protein
MDDEDYDGPPLHRGCRSFHSTKHPGTGIDGEEEEEVTDSWYQGPPDSPKSSHIMVCVCLHVCVNNLSSVHIFCI